MDDDLVAGFPPADFRAAGPNNPGRVRAGDVEWVLVDVERRDRNAKAGPHAVVVDAAGHDIDQHFVLADRPRRQDLELHRRLRRTMAFLADRPSVHLWRDITERRDFADLVKVLAHRRLQRTSRDGRHECLRNLLDRSSLPHFMLHRNIGAECRYSCDASANLFMYLLHLLTAPSTWATLRALALRVASLVADQVAVARTCLAGGGCRGWDRQHYHHDHRRRDRRLAG